MAMSCAPDIYLHVGETAPVRLLVSPDSWECLSSVDDFQMVIWADAAKTSKLAEITPTYKGRDPAPRFQIPSLVLDNPGVYYYMVREVIGLDFKYIGQTVSKLTVAA